jgi:DNA modification methylase
LGKKYLDESWDFRTADTKIYTHCFHPYPAMMIPQVTGRLIEKYGSEAELLFDPYCGAGTSLVEAELRGIRSIGTDLNPLARLISRAKTREIKLQELDMYIKSISDLTFNLRFAVKSIEDAQVPAFMNIDYWFAKDVQKKLAIIKQFIEKIGDEDIEDFFKVAFSETVRECSWTRNGEFKLFRMKEKQMSEFDPDVFGLMESKLSRNRAGLKSFMEAKNGEAVPVICQFNTVNGIPSDIIHPETVDIVVTSPPYGDSRTTVAYGQFSRLANQWLGVEKASNIDNLLMGGKPMKKLFEFESSSLREAIDKIAEKDSKRVQDVTSFYADYQRSINNVSKVVRKGGHVCYVVGNRRVKGVTLPTDEITRDFFEANGFAHVETIIRNIPNKRMPSKNSPTNVAGKLDITMNNEYIVILRKDQ